MRKEMRSDRISTLPDAVAEHGALAARFREFLATRGLRMTRERVVILDAILAARDHFDAEKLYLDLRARRSLVSRATVYRTLDLLVQCGLVDRERFASDTFSYEPMHGRAHHDHMVCTDCGHVIEFMSPEIERLQAEACAEHDFAAATHRLTIFGRCARCARGEDATAERAAAGGAGAARASAGRRPRHG
jgi:Fur family ferric uptake transcriptional regulator